MDNRGLYGKFNVSRVDGSSEPGGKHHGCQYFVLDVTHDRHSSIALLAYADSCSAQHPELAKDLRKLVEDKYRGDSMCIQADYTDIGEHLGLYVTPPEIPPHCQHGETIDVQDSEGHTVATIRHHYDPGDPGGREAPPMQGYSYWAFEPLPNPLREAQK